MKYRRVGNTELEVSEIGIGTWSIITDWWGAEVTKAEEVLRRAYQLGVTFYDTADYYGQGKGEEILGKTLSTVRDKVVILTKIGYNFYSGDHRKQDFTRDYLEEALSMSLKRLNTDYVDVLMLHNPRLNVIKDVEVYETMIEFKRDGKARVVGVALGPTLGWREEGLQAIGMGYEALEHIFNLIEREPGLTFLQHSGIGHFVRVPHASDVLDEERWEMLSNKKLHRALKDSAWVLKALEEIKNYLKEHPSPPLYQLAIQYILTHNAVSSVIPNMTSVHDVERFTRLSELEVLDEETMRTLNTLYEKKLKPLNLESEEETLAYK
ncbi:aldo/keto reductase [Sulfodiicoccus acidiphilus]|uniref:aldo/keto reductase n=1 Tax=Sulfodiicoccus acidiphilus TaxID=1670455 RepID=UPI000F82EDD0|nr:aldo/keto reductase [Sulfodiicoccus acidiphilus]